MADKKITQLTNITGADLAEADEFVVVDITADETKAITFSELKTAFDTGTGFVRITGDTMTGDLSFGTNDKAIFGAGSDLQIFHNGGNSFIQDTGVGNLYLAGSNSVLISDASASNTMATFNLNSSVNLYYANAIKLATTSTGIDVTGTVNATNALFSGYIDFQTGGVNKGNIYTDSSTMIINTQGTNTTLNTNGGNVGIGTSSPNKKIDLGWDVSSIGWAFGGDPATYNAGLNFDNPSRVLNVQSTAPDSTAAIKFSVGSSGQERMRIDSSGNVGIGTSSPDSLVHAYKASNAIIKIAEANGYASLQQSGVNSYLNSVSSGGSLIFRNGTSPTERMRIDSSGKVGIGTSSPDMPLTVQANSGANAISMRGRSDGYSELYGTSNDGSTKYAFLQTHSAQTKLYTLASTPLLFGTNSTERMRIDSSGKVGIGVSNPSSYQTNANDLVVGNLVDAGTGLTIVSGTASLGSIHFADSPTGDDSYRGFIQYGHSSNYMRFATNATERMRIDASGNVLVGKTTNGSSVTGCELRSEGFVIASMDGDHAAVFDRKTSDGVIVQLRKDNTTVGSIGVEGGDLTIGTGDTGVQFGDGGDFIRPFNISTNAPRDNAVDLGVSTTRFKNLYLSGGVYLGGAVAANKLDDYEEGDIDIANLTFTGSGSATTNTNYQTLRYTKVGQVVSITGNIYLASVTSQNGALKIPLPFTSGTGEKNRTASGTANASSNTPTFIKVDAGSSFGTLITSSGFATVTVSAGQTYLVQLTYNTS